MKKIPRAIVLVFDRWGAGFAGPYGNTWLETAAMNRLASQSALFEFALTDSPDLNAVYRSYFHGIHAAQKKTSAASLPTLLKQAGVTTRLLTDDEQIATQPSAAEFGTADFFQSPAPTQPADSMDETNLGRFFTRAIDFLHDPKFTGLLWLHARAMAGPWDAPLELRNQFADEEDLAPYSGVSSIHQRLTEGFDPDELQAVIHAYAGQVTAADLCLDTFLDDFDRTSLAQDTLLIVTAPRGYPLGEHHRVGLTDEALYGELLHIPLLVRMPNGSGALKRESALVQPPDIFATLLDWFGLPLITESWGRSLLPIIREEANYARPFSFSVRNSNEGDSQEIVEAAIRTPAWFLRNSSHGKELFGKPDDRWEANEVNRLCSEETEQLVAELMRLIGEQTQPSGPLS